MRKERKGSKGKGGRQQRSGRKGKGRGSEKRVERGDEEDVKELPCL